METRGNLIERVRNAFGRTADRVSGHHVPVVHGSEPLEGVTGRPHARPPADVLENDREILIRADVPGATTDNTRAHWGDDRTLHLYVQMDPPERRRALLQEWTPRDWYRAFRLPAHADGDAARCSVRNGVVTIHVPKREAAPVQIPVRTAG